MSSFKPLPGNRATRATRAACATSVADAPRHAAIPCRRLLLSLAASAVVFGASAAQAEIHFGVILSTTGPAASLGVPAEMAIKLWPAELAGEKLRFTILNEGSDPTGASKNAAKLITEDKVDAIIGASVTPPSLAVVEVAG